MKMYEGDLIWKCHRHFHHVCLWSFGIMTVFILNAWTATNMKRFWTWHFQSSGCELPVPVCFNKAEYTIHQDRFECISHEKAWTDPNIGNFEHEFSIVRVWISRSCVFQQKAICAINHGGGPGFTMPFKLIIFPGLPFCRSVCSPDAGEGYHKPRNIWLFL